MRPFLLLFVLANPLVRAAEINESPDHYFKKARKLRDEDPREAFRMYSEALRYSDTSWKHRCRCYIERGSLLLDHGKLIPAMMDFEAALQLEPKNAEAHRYAALICFRIKKFSRALGHLEQWEELEPRDEEVHFYRGRIFLYLQNAGTSMMEGNMLHSAIEEFNLAIDKKRKYPEALYFRGKAHFSGGLFEEAMEDFDKAIKYRKDYYQAWYEKSKLHLKMKQNIRSIESLEQCLKHKENLFPALRMIIMLCHESRFIEKVRYYIEKGLEHFPRHPFFRHFNGIYAVIPESELPEMPETAAPVHGVPDSQENPSPPESTWLEIPENWEDLDDPVPSKKASSSAPAPDSPSQKPSEKTAPPSSPEPEKPEAPTSKPPPPRKKEEKKKTEPEAVFPENNWY